MLYFEETVYGLGYYQLIRPVGENQILKHYRWVKNKQVCRTFSVSSSIREPLICSSCLSKQTAEFEETENPQKRPRLSSSTGDYDTQLVGKRQLVATFAKDFSRRKCLKKKMSLWIILPQKVLRNFRFVKIYSFLNK